MPVLEKEKVGVCETKVSKDSSSLKSCNLKSPTILSNDSDATNNDSTSPRTLPVSNDKGNSSVPVSNDSGMMNMFSKMAESIIV